MNASQIKNALGVPSIVPTFDVNEDGSINKEWLSAFLPTVKSIVSIPVEVYNNIKTSNNLHLVAKGEVIVKDVPYQRYIIAEHKDINPERIVEGF